MSYRGTLHAPRRSESWASAVASACCAGMNPRRAAVLPGRVQVLVPYEVALRNRYASEGQVPMLLLASRQPVRVGVRGGTVGRSAGPTKRAGVCPYEMDACANHRVELLALVSDRDPDEQRAPRFQPDMEVNSAGPLPAFIHRQTAGPSALQRLVLNVIDDEPIRCGPTFTVTSLAFLQAQRSAAAILSAHDARSQW